MERKYSNPLYAIQKYPLINQNTFKIAEETSILKVAKQGSNIVMWAAVPLVSVREMSITPYIHSAEAVIDTNLCFYYDTIIDKESVWHIFLEKHL